jgi:hypothetical protein
LGKATWRVSMKAPGNCLKHFCSASSDLIWWWYATKKILMLTEFILTCTERQNYQQVNDINNNKTYNWKDYRLVNHYIPFPDELLPQERIHRQPIQVCKTHTCPVDKPEFKRTSKYHISIRTTSYQTSRTSRKTISSPRGMKALVYEKIRSSW